MTDDIKKTPPPPRPPGPSPGTSKERAEGTLPAGAPPGTSPGTPKASQKSAPASAPTTAQAGPRLVAHNRGLLAKNLGKRFKKRPVVRGVTISLQRGEVVGLLGPNGAGKTTCFYMITGLMPPDYGTIILDGEDITDLPMYRRARLGIGYLPLEASIFRGLSVENNIRAVLEVVEKNRDRREAILEALLAEFSITHLRRTPALALSGGERRRVEIARALASNPHFVLLDEPFAGIDPIAVADIRDLVAHLKDRGIGVLAGLLEDDDERVRARALAALSQTSPEILAPMIERFVADTNPEVRSLAVACAAPQSEHAERLALHDPDAEVRLRALSAFGGQRPDIATAALADPDEAVRAAALEQVVSQPGLPADDDLLANVIAWTRTAGAKLAGTCAAALPRLAGERAAEPLIALASDDTRPVEARAAALGGLGHVAGEGVAGEGVVEQLRASATDPMRPVRVAALAGLARICGEGAAAANRSLAEETLAAAMTGDLHGAGAAAADEAANETADEAVDAENEGLAATKGEGEGQRRVTITRDGEIVEQAAAPEPEPLPPSDASDRSDTNVIAGRFPQSTLEAIQAPANVGSGAGDVTLSDSDLSFLELAQGGRRRGRVSVDGPSEIGDDLRITALRIGACSGGESIEQAIAGALAARTQSVRAAAFEALARRAEAGPVSSALVDLATAAISDPDALVRGYCARMVRAASPDAAALLMRQIEDPDATVRAEALKAVGARAGQPRLAGLTDPSSVVRTTALQLVLEHGDDDELAQGLTICIERGNADVLRKAWAASPIARELIVRSLADDSATTRQIRVALDAIMGAG